MHNKQLLYIHININKTILNLRCEVILLFIYIYLCYCTELLRQLHKFITSITSSTLLLQVLILYYKSIFIKTFNRNYYTFITFIYPPNTCNYT